MVIPLKSVTMWLSDFQSRLSIQTSQTQEDWLSQWHELRVALSVWIVWKISF